MSSPGGFQRARRPEQIEVRRNTILTAARTLLDQHRVAEVSLRELADKVGMAMSNVLRYFDRREAVFLELLDEEGRGWLEDLAATDPKISATDPCTTEQARVANAVASTLLARPLLCELLSTMASVLERNISVEFARDFKQRSFANRARLAHFVGGRLPDLSEEDAERFAAMTLYFIAGLWPFTKPTAPVLTLLTEMGRPPSPEATMTTLRDALTHQLLGLTAGSTR